MLQPRDDDHDRVDDHHSGQGHDHDRTTTTTQPTTTSSTAAVLPTTIEQTTTTLAVTPTTRGTQVLGETVPRNALAVTGAAVTMTATLGATLIALGLALMAATKRQRFAER